MARRDRNAIVIRLNDGEVGIRQREAIEAFARSATRWPNESTTSVLRALLLIAAGRDDLIVDVAPLDPRFHPSDEERARLERDVGGDPDRRID